MRVRPAVSKKLAWLLGAPLRVRDSPQRADAIVILGAPLRPDGSLSGVLEERVRAGVALWSRGLAPIVCVTGGPMRGAPELIEADAMARRARQLGVPDSCLRLERQAQNTADNARLVARLLAPEGCRRVWIVSQPFHLRRARWLFRKTRLDPLVWHADESIEWTSPNGLRWVAREYASIVQYVAIEARLLCDARGSRTGPAERE